MTMVAEALAYALFMIFVGRRLPLRSTAWVLRAGDDEMSLPALAVLLILIFRSAAITNAIGLFSVFGAFIVGAVLYDQHEFREAVVCQLRDFVTVFFLPIFFTYTGLRTDIGGCGAAAPLNGLAWKEAWCVGVLMNTRGLMELIAVNLGHDLGVISGKRVFHACPCGRSDNLFPNSIFISPW